MPILYVKNRNGDIIHLEESYSSLVWTERYQEHGDFVLDLPLGIVDRSVYAKGNYISMDDSDFVMLIEKTGINDDPEDQKFTVSGRTLSCILERRVNASKVLTICNDGIVYSGNLDDVVSQLLNDEIIDPKIERYDTYKDEETQEYKTVIVEESSSERKIPNFTYTNNITEDLTVKASFNDVKTVYDILVSLSKKNITGFKIDLTDNAGFKLITYKGKDHTTSQYTNTPLIFGPVMDNVAYMNSYSDMTDFKTVALALDESYEYSNLSGMYTWVDNPNSNANSTGLDRREVLISSSATSDDDDSTEENPLVNGALEKFDSGDYDIVSVSEGSIDTLVRYGIDKDYYIGDIVDMIDHFGNHYKALINEVVRSYDGDGYIVTPNFESMQDYDYGEEDSDVS